MSGLPSFKRLYNQLRFDIRQSGESNLTGKKRSIYRFIKVLVLAFKGFIKDKLAIRASALSYSILFAMVPMFALIIAFAKGFSAEATIENAFQGTYFDQVQLIPTVMGFADRYLSSIHGRLFIGAGILILLWSVMNFFIQVENVFNGIWHVKKRRSPISQFTTYFSAMLIIPVLVIVSGGLSVFVSSSVSQFYIYQVISPVLRIGFKFIPYIIDWILFTILYMFMPNTRVKLKNALVAGIVAGSAFQIFQMMYINGQVYLSRYNVIYGGFAALPLLLLWLHISGMIVLLGAEISFVSQNIHNIDFENESKSMSQRYRNFVILFIVNLITKRFERKESPLSAFEIANNYNLPFVIVNQILIQLSDAKILTIVHSEDGKLVTYQPAFDIHKLTIDYLFSTLNRQGAEMFLNNNHPQLEVFWNKMMEINNQSGTQSDMVLVKDL